MESMDDYKEELEASLKKIRVGDVVTGTVLDVTDDAVKNSSILKWISE